MAEISVIVPVYNVESYLSRCVDSVLNQTYRDLELILVDDGSPDGSPAICDAYAEKDQRVHVIHQKNGGLSAARNAGLDYLQKHSESSWLFFLDSDDWIHEKTLESMLNACIQTETAVCTCGDYETTGESKEINPGDLTPQVYETRQLYREKTILMVASCGKLFRRECFHGIRFPLGKLHEDEFTTHRVLFKYEKQSLVPAPLYAYFTNPGSIMRVNWSPRRMDAWEAFESQVTYFDNRKDREMAELCLGRYLENANNQLIQLSQLEDQTQYASYVPLVKKKIRSLIAQEKKRGCFDFDESYAILWRLNPVTTKLQLYWRAGVRRLKGRKNA